LREEGIHIMRHINSWTARLALGALAVMASAATTHAAGNVVMALDGMLVNNSGGGQPSWGGFGRFQYGDTFSVGTSPTLGRYDSFTISETGGVGTSAGGGVGLNYAIGNVNTPVDSVAGPVRPVTANMFPILDRAVFGINFDPNQYVAELIYKPLAGNTATQLNVTLDTPRRRRVCAFVQQHGRFEPGGARLHRTVVHVRQ
jgi:hypothetical protein